MCCEGGVIFEYILFCCVHYFLFTFSLSFQYKGTSSALSAIPVPKSLISRVPSSVEGINHELENVFIREDWEHGIQVGM